MVLMPILSVGPVLVPFLPGVRSILRWIPLHRLVWRSSYRAPGRRSRAAQWSRPAPCSPVRSWPVPAAQTTSARSRSVSVVEHALAQIPDRWRSKIVLIRADGAGYLYALTTALSEQGLGSSVGYPVTEAVRDAIKLIPKWAWTPANNADGGLREHADVVEVTGMLDLTRWTATCPWMRVIVGREHPHPGATLDAFEIRDGYRYQAFTTNTPGGQLPFLDARHRAHARVEDRIRTGKDTGIGHLPSRHTHINQVWVELALIAADLLALAQTVLLTDQSDLVKAEPKTLRYRLPHIAGRSARGQHKVVLRLADH